VSFPELTLSEKVDFSMREKLVEASKRSYTDGLFLCNIGFTPKIKLQSNFRAEELTSITPTDKWALVIRDYDTQTLVKGDWIFNPGGMAIKRFSTEIGLACLAVVSSCSRPALSALPSAPYALAPLSRRD